MYFIECMCVLCVFDMYDVWGIYSALYQGQASCALNLPSCRCTEKGQMSLEGSYWGGGGIPFSILGLCPNPECSREVCEP